MTADEETARKPPPFLFFSGCKTCNKGQSWIQNKREIISWQMKCLRLFLLDCVWVAVWAGFQHDKLCWLILKLFFFPFCNVLNIQLIYSWSVSSTEMLPPNLMVTAADKKPEQTIHGCDSEEAWHRHCHSLCGIRGLWWPFQKNKTKRSDKSFWWICVFGILLSLCLPYLLRKQKLCLLKTLVFQRILKA